MVNWKEKHTWIQDGIMYCQAHCDSKVCHSPESGCEYCNMYPDVQQHRIDNNINFTGEFDEAKKPDPATQARDLSNINAWKGNQPHNPSMPASQKHKLAAGESFSSKVMYGFADLDLGDSDAINTTSPPLYTKPPRGRIRRLWDRYCSRGS